MTSTNLIYIRENRIYFTPKQVEYDVTEFVQELFLELEKLKKR